MSGGGIAAPPSESTAVSGASAGERVTYLDDLGITLAPAFDVTAYINARFPDETALETSLEPYLDTLQHAIARADAHLSDQVREQSRETRLAHAPLAASDQSLRELQGRLATLGESATSTAAAANKAIEPARPLYHALTNTTATLDALDALVRLDEGVAVLEAAAGSRSLELIATDLSVFDTVRDALEALTPLSTAASPTRAARRLAALRARARQATDTLRDTVLQQFKAHAPAVAAAAVGAGDGTERVEAVATLRTVCGVGAALGDDVRAELVAAHVTARVAAFRAAFMADDGGLSGVERRFAWLRKELRSNWRALGAAADQDWGLIFPAEWDVASRLTNAVVAEMRSWTEKVLDGGADGDVDTMVAALGKSKAFEDELERRFAGAARFEKAISEAYGPWMGRYVEREDVHLAEVVREVLREESWVCEDGNVLNSAKMWFLAVKKSMKMCAALDNRQPLYLLHGVFKKHLATYAVALIRKLPGLHGNALADSSNWDSFEDKIVRACAVVTTAEYCAGTIRQLEGSIRNAIHPSFQSDVDMNKECDSFSTVSAKAVHAVVALLDEDLHANLRAFRDTDWAAWPSVGDSSPYVATIAASAHKSVPIVRARLSRQHFRFFLDKYGAAFVATLARHVYRTDNMSHFAAQQILLDTSALRSLLVALPITGGPDSGGSSSRAAPTLYVKNVGREIAKIEAVLKVILAPLDSCIDTYLALVPGGSADAFRHILDMRGVRRAEAAPLVLDLARRLSKTDTPRSSPVGSADILAARLNAPPRPPAAPLDDVLPIAPPPQPPVRKSVSQAPGSGIRAPPPKTSSSDTVIGSFGAAMGGMSVSGVSQGAAQASEAAVDSMKTFFGRMGNWGSSLKDAGIADRLGQGFSQIGNSTAEAVARLGGNNAQNAPKVTK